MRFKKNKYNNKKIEAYGIKFDSSREKYMYDELVSHNIPFQFQKKYILMNGFKNRKGKKIRDITAIVDFVVEYDDLIYIIDVKGLFLEVAKIKYKLLESILHEGDKDYELLFPSNKIMINDIVKELKRKTYGEKILLSL